MNQRGIAMPAALFGLVILTSLMIAFTLLAQSEPELANNHMMTARARAFAEAGVERAMWALQPINLAASGLSDPLPAPVPPPYDGSQYLWAEQVNGVTVGESKVIIAAVAGDPDSLDITAVGYAPDHNNPRAIRKIVVRVTRFALGGPNGTPPCAMCVGGEVPTGSTAQVQVGGSAMVNGATSGNPPASYCADQDTTTMAAIMTTGTVDTNVQPSIIAPPGGQGWIQGVAKSTFTAFTLTDAQMQVLKAYAKASGPGHYYQGSQTFTSPPPDGLLFFDTPSGNPLTNSSPSSDKITIDMHGNWSAGWNGWIIIAGSADISGDVRINGMVYAQNDVQIHGNGNQRITGAVVAQDRVDSASTTLDSEEIGNGKLAYNCQAIRDGGGTGVNNWRVSSYKEVEGT